MSSNNYYIGIDVSKGYADFVVLDNKKVVVLKPMKFYDTFEGHGKLHAFLGDFCKSHEVDKIYSAVESTGAYENNWYAALRRFSQDYPICVTRVNPYGVHHSHKAHFNRVTTDKISAFSIAEYLINDNDNLIYDYDDKSSSLKRQVTHIRLLKTQKVQLLNQLESFVYIAFPELLKDTRNGFTHWILNLLLRYPTADKVRRAIVTSIAKIPNITSKKAEELIIAARQTVASGSNTTIASIIQSIVSQVLALEKLIDWHINKLLPLQDNRGYEILQSFPGIAKWSASVLLIEIGNVERFASAKELASYFGLNPKFKQSGDGISKSVMSK